MFGYACDDTPELMPLPITIAHRLAERLSEVRKDGTMAYLRPDGKTQVTIEYDGDRPVRVDTVVVSSQHAGDIDLEHAAHPRRRRSTSSTPVLAELRHRLRRTTGCWSTRPAGSRSAARWATPGLTGRKIIIDTYGGMARHGGGAFSGKDPSKVDRSAAYAMRWVAKNVVAAGLARRCEVQVAYAIGKAHPVGLYVETLRHRDGAGRHDPGGGRSRSSTCGRPRSSATSTCCARSTRQTAAYGHFGRELPDFTWERTDRVDALKAAVGA